MSPFRITYKALGYLTLVLNNVSDIKSRTSTALWPHLVMVAKKLSKRGLGTNVIACFLKKEKETPPPLRGRPPPQILESRRSITRVE